MAGTGGPDCQWFCSGRRIPTVLPDLYLAQIRTIRTVGPLCLPSTALRLDKIGLIVLIVLIRPSFKFSKISNYSNYSKLIPLVIIMLIMPLIIENYRIMKITNYQ